MLAQFPSPMFLKQHGQASRSRAVTLWWPHAGDMGTNPSVGCSSGCWDREPAVEAGRRLLETCSGAPACKAQGAFGGFQTVPWHTEPTRGQGAGMDKKMGEVKGVKKGRKASMCYQCVLKAQQMLRCSLWIWASRTRHTNFSWLKTLYCSLYCPQQELEFCLGSSTLRKK